MLGSGPAKYLFWKCLIYNLRIKSTCPDWMTEYSKSMPHVETCWIQMHFWPTFNILPIFHLAKLLLPPGWPFIALRSKTKSLFWEGLEQRRGCDVVCGAFASSRSRPLLTPRCPGWWGFLSKLLTLPTRHHTKHQPFSIKHTASTMKYHLMHLLNFSGYSGKITKGIPTGKENVEREGRALPKSFGPFRPSSNSPMNWYIFTLMSCSGCLPVPNRMILRKSSKLALTTPTPTHHFVNYIADLFWKSEVLVIFTTIIIIF